MITRRKMLTRGAGLLAAGGLLLSRWREALAQPAGHGPAHEHDLPTPPMEGNRIGRRGPSQPTRVNRPVVPPPQPIARRLTGTRQAGLPYLPVVTPDGFTLPYRMENGVKVFHLVAEPVVREFAPGLVVNCWGYNGTTPGPTIEVVEGDRVRIHLTNRLPEPTTIHWHGILLPYRMDGVGGLTQPHVKPGQTFTYEFTIRQPASTHMYHPHLDEMTQVAMGMQGFFIIHPRRPRQPLVERDFCIFLNEWRIDPGTYTPVTTEMLDFNYFTMNSRVFPGTSPLVVRKGQRVRVRLGNVMMNMHPIHLHGFVFEHTGNDGGPFRRENWLPGTTVMVPPGQAHDFEFIADEPGDWALHCHKTHHVMNGMIHDLPNLIGIDPERPEAEIKKLLPGYMLMGNKGGLMNHDMGGPENTVSMFGPPGPFGDRIDMSGMFTIVKVREGITSYEDPGWYSSAPDPIWWRWQSLEPPEDYRALIKVV